MKPFGRDLSYETAIKRLLPSGKNSSSKEKTHASSPSTSGKTYEKTIPKRIETVRKRKRLRRRIQ